MKYLKHLIITLIFSFNSILSDYKRKLDNIIKTRDDLQVSKYFLNFEKGLKVPNITFSIKEDFSQSKNFSEVVDYKTKSLTLPEFLTSTTEVLDYFVESIKQDGKLLNPNNDYGFNITYGESLITDLDRPIINYPANKGNLKVELNIFQPNIFSLFFKTNSILLNSHVVIDNLIIGIDNENKLKAYIFIKGKFSEFDIEKRFKASFTNFKTESSFKQIILDSNFGSKKRYLTVTNQQYTAYTFEIDYDVTDDSETISLNLKYYFTDNLLAKNKIIDFVHENGYLYIAIQENGIVVVENNSKIFHLIEFDHKRKIPLRIKDMQQIQDTIYILIENYGLKILNLNKDSDTKLNYTDFQFEHPYLSRMEIHKNKNLNEYFLGILVDSKSFDEGHEFFFELSLKDHYKPTLHKLFLTDKYIDITTILNDDKYTYLFEKSSNALLVLSRSITATKFNSIFEVKINNLKNKKVISEPIMFKDKKNKKTHLGFMTKDFFSYSEDFELTQGDLNVRFHEKGNYEIKLKAFADYCEDSKDTKSKCYLSLNYNFNVQNLFSAELKDIFYSYTVGVFIFLNILTLLIYCKYYYRKPDIEFIIKQEIKQTELSNRSNNYIPQADENDASQQEDNKI